MYIFLFTIFPFFTFSQSLYNPQDLYDVSAGLFDEDSLRVIDLEFYMPTYHNYLVYQSFRGPIIKNESVGVISQLPEGFKHIYTNTFWAILRCII